jgi:NAD(P)-dependent dehydrogenase (short-subunit alcohol dehydrogenase family)
MGNKHVLITGGASGLGLGCAMCFLKLDFKVTIADIDEAAALRAIAALEGLGVSNFRPRFEKLDLADANSILELARRMIARGEPVDVLINNAGIYPPSLRTLSKEGHELTFAIAHLGHFRLTHALWPLLEAAEAARVVSISSMVQKNASLALDDLILAEAYQPIRAYQQAKLSCLLFALELQRKLDAAESRISSFAAHPGVCRSQLARNRRLSAQDQWWQRLSSMMLSFGMKHFGQSPENGAASVVEAATSENIPRGAFIGPTGFMQAMGKPGIVRPGPAAANPQLAGELWKRSEALTGIAWQF